MSQKNESKKTAQPEPESIETPTVEVLGVTKMSVNSICGKKSMGRICVILGRANGIKTGEDAQGKVWEALTGTFEGRNLQTGEVFRSGKLFLPSGIHETIVDAVKALPEGVVGAATFAFEIRRVEASNPIGYTYQAVPLIKTEIEKDELHNVLNAIGDRMPKAVKQIAASSSAA
jgi:hypothetical protein